VVAVDRVREDHLYSKRATIQKRYYVDDAAGIATEGDLVKIRETRPISKLKRRKLVEVIQK
jgi:small subunit ribosomal protein S17